MYKEQDKEKVKECLQKTEGIPSEEINYVDEAGIQKFLHREYAYAPRGEKSEFQERSSEEPILLLPKEETVSLLLCNTMEQ